MDEHQYQEYMKLSLDELKQRITSLNVSYFRLMCEVYMSRNKYASNSLETELKAIKNRFDSVKKIYDFKLKQKELSEDFDEV